jgi:hypothetical protein
MLREWEDLLKEADKASRDRLFVLTTAAEKGWSVATDLAAGMRGDLANKNLARAIKKDDKKKLEKTKEKEKEKAKPKKSAFRGNYRYNPYYNPYAYGQPPPPPPPAAAAATYGGRGVPKICSYCKAAGHYFRECPMRPAAPAALGAPPK